MGGLDRSGYAVAMTRARCRLLWPGGEASAAYLGRHRWTVVAGDSQRVVANTRAAAESLVELLDQARAPRARRLVPGVAPIALSRDDAGWTIRHGAVDWRRADDDEVCRWLEKTLGRNAYACARDDIAPWVRILNAGFDSPHLKFQYLLFAAAVAIWLVSVYRRRRRPVT